MVRTKERRQGQGAKGMRKGEEGCSPQASFSYFLDPLLVPRLEQYSHNHDLGDAEPAVEYLRRNYREYRRKQLVPFRKQVLRGIRLLLQSESRQESGVVSAASDSPSEGEDGQPMRHAKRGSRCLEEREELFLAKRRKSMGPRGNGEEEEEEEEDSSMGDDEGIRLNPGFNLLNSSILATYQGRPALLVEKSDSPPTVQESAPKAAAEGSPLRLRSPASKSQEEQASSPQQNGNMPAFAPLHIIAAAATAARSTAKDSNSSTSETPKSPKEALNLSTLETPTLPSHPTPRPANSETKAKPSKHAHQPKRATPEGKKERKSSMKTSPEAVRFSDLGGMENALGQVIDAIYPLCHPGPYRWLGVEPIRGILLFGPPGCGKTSLAYAIAHETGLPFLKISATEIVSGMSGESEAKIRGLFMEAASIAPSIIFIDEIDAISTRRENAQREMERRIVTQLMTCMDELSFSSKRLHDDGDASNFISDTQSHVLVIGATNRPDALDPALRRPGRFEREICVGIPDENGRAQILLILSKNLKLEGSFDFKRIARLTPGFVGADLAAVTREAASLAIKRIIASRNPISQATDNAIEATQLANEGIFTTNKEKPIVHAIDESEVWWKVPWTEKEIKELSITMQDFEKAVSKVQPSGKREGFSEIPDVRWEDVGALDSLQSELSFLISRRIKHPEEYEELGLDMDTGILLYGPPGCGKTLVAKAVANDAQANFIYIKGPELLNKYVGESELAVRSLFSRARSCSPCIIFFDEMDALAPRRGTDGNAVAERVLNQLLTEMDGLDKRKGIFLMAATNRPDMIDPAILRPGRLGKLVFIPLPDSEGRISMLKALTRKKPLSPDVDLVTVAQNEACTGLSGADLAALVNEACVAAMQERMLPDGKIEKNSKCESPLLVCNRHFETAFCQVSPSVSKQELLYYQGLPRKFRSKGVHGMACGELH